MDLWSGTRPEKSRPQRSRYPFVGLRRSCVLSPLLTVLFFRDEIDKIGQSNFHGDPGAALLEVLDPEQNHTFNVRLFSVNIVHFTDLPVFLESRIIISMSP